MSQVAAFGRLCGTTAARARPARGTPAASSLGQYRHGAPVKTPADEIAHEDPRILRCPSWIHTPNAVFSRYGAGESFLPQSKEHQRTLRPVVAESGLPRCFSGFLSSQKRLPSLTR